MGAPLQNEKSTQSYIYSDRHPTERYGGVLWESRYENPVKFTGEKGDHPVFGGIHPRKIVSAAGVIEYTIKEGDRLDLL